MKDYILDTKLFYNSVARMFSTSRQKSWTGWFNLTPKISNSLHNNIDVCDLGCGNGRFLKFLQKELPKYKINYEGFDNSSELLEIARKEASGGTFTFLDVFTGISQIDKKYDLVVCFGLTHHLPEAINRKKWFECVSNILKEDGLFVVTFWNFDKDKRFEKAEKIGEEDFLLPFGKSGVKRYFHKYSQNEIDECLTCFEVIDSFEADGKSNNLNTYYILKKEGHL